MKIKNNDYTLKVKGLILNRKIIKALKNYKFTIYWNDCFKLWHQANLVETNGVSYYQNLKGASHNVFVSATYTFKKRKTIKEKVRHKVR